MLKFFFSAVALLIITTTPAFGVTPESLAHGLPKVAAEIGEHSFVPVELERLKDAKVWYVNYDWHREHGVPVPADGLSSREFRDQILRAYAWQSHMATDDANHFTGEKKMAYADYYGGNGAGTNHGSGRAAAFGLVQIKGVKTSLAKSADAFHSNGAVQTIEAVDEAIWSELLEGEFHKGSNKIVAIILTGTYGQMKSGQVFPRALIVREMAVRPAHFMLSPARQYWSTPGDDERDTERVVKSLPGLLESLPYPPEFRSKDPAEKLRVGFLHLMELEAQAQAEYVAHRLFFGSYSPSNMEITGRRLDLGDHTSQEGYTPIYRVEHLSHTPFGGTKYFEELFGEFHSSLLETLEKSVTKTLLKSSKIGATFNEFFEKHRAIEFTRLTGVPDEILETLKTSPEVQTLGKVIDEVARVGAPNAPVLAAPQGWENTSKYNVNELLKSLAAAHVTDANATLAVVNRAIDDETLAKKFATAYAEFKFAAQREARANGISVAAFETFMKEAAARRNLNRPDLVRGDRRWRELWDTTDRAIAVGDGDPKFIQSYIEKQVDQALSDVKTDLPFTLVLSEKRDSAAGRTVQRVFDARSGEFATVTKFSMNEGHVALNGRLLSADELKRVRLEIRDPNRSLISVRSKMSGNTVSFVTPDGVTLESARIVDGVNSVEDVAIKRTSNERTERPRLRDVVVERARSVYRMMRPIRTCDAVFAP